MASLQPFAIAAVASCKQLAIIDHRRSGAEGVIGVWPQSPAAAASLLLRCCFALPPSPLQARRRGAVGPGQAGPNGGGAAAFAFFFGGTFFCFRNAVFWAAHPSVFCGPCESSAYPDFNARWNGEWMHPDDAIFVGVD
jgi:hypothetical protein